jgi:hypothetical protein
MVLRKESSYRNRRYRRNQQQQNKIEKRFQTNTNEDGTK